jgi:hypothetical protein
MSESGGNKHQQRNIVEGNSETDSSEHEMEDSESLSRGENRINGGQTGDGAAMEQRNPEFVQHGERVDRLRRNVGDTVRGNFGYPQPIDVGGFENTRIMSTLKTGDIEKLNGENYKTWAMDIELTLRTFHLWNLILGLMKFDGEINQRPYNNDERFTVYRVIYQSCDGRCKNLIVDDRDATERSQIIKIEV